MSPKVTIRDVAEKAGVSYQTVSRVLNNRSDVSAETRQRVLTIIDDLNYRPSLAARIMNQERTMIIGIIMPYDPEYLASDTHQLQIVCGANQQASLQDYSTLLSTPRSMDDKLSAYHRFLRERHVDGVIVEGEGGILGAQYLIDKGYPVVIVGYNHAGIHCVHSDDEGGAYGLTQHLVALGHRRIGIINGLETSLAIQARWRGYERALHDAGLEPDKQLVQTGDFTAKSGYQAAECLMQAQNPPTAIFAFNDSMAMGAIHWLHEHNYQVPTDVSVVGFDDIPISDHFNPALTTVHQHSYALGQRAAEILIDLIDGIAPQTSENILPIYLVVRRSTASVRI